MDKYKFTQCSCEFPCSGSGDNLKIAFDPNIDNIPLDCIATWDLISSGNTKGVFQLESRLGQMLAKKLKPRNIEHLAALVAIMRPGCLEAVRDGKSVTEHYIARKNGIDPVTYFHPSLESSLGSTYGEMIYQEQAMKIARDLAGFSLQDADVLRKAIGKKKADIMSQVEETFMKGCAKAQVVPEDIAHEIFEWIRKSQRYSFNKSHSVSYAINAYLSAYGKAHFKRAFFTSYLYYAAEKIKPQDEVRELVNNTKSMEVDVFPPDLRKRNKHFTLINKGIYFGLVDVKGVGNSVLIKMEKEIGIAEEKLGRALEQWSWSDFLLFLAPRINKSAVEALIKVGALRWFNTERQKMWFDFEQYSVLSDKEQEWLENKYVELKLENQPLSSLLELVLNGPVGRGGAVANKKRVEKVKSVHNIVVKPPLSLTDTPEWIASVEESLMGIPITCTIVDSCDVSSANATCHDFIIGSTKKDGILIAAKIDMIKETVTKNGKNPGKKMAFLSISDSSGSIESCVVFPEQWAASRGKVFEGNTLMIGGERGREKDSFVVNQVWQI